MQQYGFISEFDVFQNVDEVVDIMAVNGAEIFKVERLEQHAGCYKGFKRVFRSFCKLVNVVTNFWQ